MRAGEWADPEAEAADIDATEPTAPQPAMDEKSRDEVKGVLEKLAKGELNIDDAAAALDAARRSR
jgi:hypothetical protein